ncbi:hypothetical protein GF322_00405 [Candidatus Dependentiae bacterium]|nr:hypothetical protein [Candidatus Dependentiae bacterium]
MTGIILYLLLYTNKYFLKLKRLKLDSILNIFGMKIQETESKYFMKDDKHNFFMQKALSQAKLALKRNEVPVGAIIVTSSGNIIGRGYNKIESKKCQTAHAEVIAITKACKVVGDWRLDNCWLYVTLEPCLMCYGLIKLSRIKGLIFGARSDLFGFGYKKKGFLKLVDKKLLIKGYFKEQECIDILQQFFKILRNKKRKVSK